MKRFLAISVLMLLALGCEERKHLKERFPAQDGLVLVTTLGSAPYAYRDEATGEITGIDIEIAREAAKKLKLKLNIEEKEFPELLPAVKSGKADFAAAAITITPSRARDVVFSDPYASDGSAFIYRASDKKPTIPTAANLRIGTQMASISHFYLCYHDIDPYCFNEYEEALKEFKNGKLDAVFYDAEPIRETVRTSNGEYAMTPLETRENYGIAVRKDFPRLVEAVNQTIEERGKN
ncbi:MAG: ABC transporter substrate-binding protein [Kiritimatiellae bacterium]|nr:ABC transporter substrate-binding protein [Kiritimatiellia bacterium]